MYQYLDDHLSHRQIGSWAFRNRAGLNPTILNGTDAAAIAPTDGQLAPHVGTYHLFHRSKAGQ